jgi:hypothetical protein
MDNEQSWCKSNNLQCPKEIEWYPVKVKLLYGMKSISLTDSDEYIIPNHLIEENIKIKQYNIIITFFDYIDESQINNSINKSNYSVESIEYRKDGAVYHAGPLFKRSGYTGYWMLKVPCLSCYIKIAEECNDDIDVLTKASILCNLNGVKMINVKL